MLESPQLSFANSEHDSGDHRTGDAPDEQRPAKAGQDFARRRALELLIIGGVRDFYALSREAGEEKRRYASIRSGFGDQDLHILRARMGGRKGFAPRDGRQRS